MNLLAKLNSVEAVTQKGETKMQIKNIKASYRCYLSLFLTCLIFAATVTKVKAGGLDNLIKYTQRDGSMTNVNSGGIVSDQRAGYISGGSIVSRGPKPKVLRPLVVQAPSFEFDPCSGSYDARFGGLSFVKGAAFTDFLKTLPAATGAYAFKMLIKEVCPHCEDITSYLETVLRDINGLSLNQCAMAKSIAQGGFSMLTSASKQRCMMKSNVLSASSDMFEATENCTDNPDRFGEAGDEDKLKSLLGDNFNLVWKALSRGDASSANTSFRELIMSISGSVIGRKDAESFSFINLPSLVEKEDLLEKYIGKPGGQSSEVTLYKCDESKKCLEPSEQKVKVPADETLYGNVTRLLTSIVEKVYANEGVLTDDEQALIEFSSMPLINIIEMELATKNKESAGSFVGTHEFIEVVCYDMITNYMQKMLVEARSSVDLLKSTQLDSTAINNFAANVDKVRSYLRDKRFEAFKKLQIITQVKERIAQQQSVFELGFSRFMDSRSRSY